MPARWTNKEIDLLKKMTADGASTEEISIKIGRSPSAIKTKLKSTTMDSLPEKEVVTPKAEIDKPVKQTQGGFDANEIPKTPQPESEKETSMIPYIIGIIVLAAIVVTLMT